MQKPCQINKQPKNERDPISEVSVSVEESTLLKIDGLLEAQTKVVITEVESFSKWNIFNRHFSTLRQVCI